LDLRFLLVLLCFLASGFAGLLYETAWTREFSFVFGTSNLAVATVLAAYMAGLSLGATLAGRFLHHIRRPVLVYGLLELAIAGSALAVPSLIRAVSWLYRPLFASAELLPEAGGLASALFYAVASFAILGIPTTLMGATLPLLARHAVREERQIGRRIGVLYATNTAGAVAGTVVTAFVLLPTLGLRETVWVGAALNALVFAAAAAVARGAPEVAAEPAPAREPSRAAAPILAVAFATSAASFLYENLWFRLFEHVLGASVYAFSTMLAGFLIGISLGGALAAPFARTRAGSTRALAATQLAAAALSFAAFWAVDALPELAVRVNQPNLLGLLARASVAAALLLPSTLAIGASFPFAVRALTDRVENAGAASARVYAWNTLGAIVGSLAAGFVVIPALGFEHTLVATAFVNLAAAALAASALRPRSRRVLAFTAAAAVALALVQPSTPWNLVGTGPLSLDTHARATGNVVDPRSVLYLAVGRSATVLLHESEQGYHLRTNGLPEATIERTGALPGKAPTGRALTLLPAFAPADPRDMLVIGFGGGVAVEEVPSTFERIDVVELEAEVLAANRLVAERRRKNPLADPRVTVYVNDARGALALTGRRYGAIVSQPSHPWTAGASHLYTRDFFLQVREHLAPGGVFVQWMGLPFVDEGLLRSLIATLVDAFGHVRLYQAEPNSVLFVSSSEPFDLEARVEAVVARDPDGFGRQGVRVREDVASMLALDDVGTRALATDAPLISDDRNLLATHSPRVLGQPLRTTTRLFFPHDPLLGDRAGLDVPYLVARLVERGFAPRAERVAKDVQEPVARLLAHGELALARGRRAEALDLARRALERDPSSARARYRVATLALPGESTGAAERDPGAQAALVLRARELHRQRDWAALAGLDEALAGFAVRDPGRSEAGSFRVDWRLGEGSVERAREALELLENEPSLGADFVARRALAGARTASPGVARESLAALVKLTEKAQLPPLMREWTVAALDRMPQDELPEGALELRHRLAPARGQAAAR
jgi:spermidine synthase